MAIKIVATDLDGTLLTPDHITVTERTKNALKTAHDRGVKIVIATGRTLSIIGAVISQIPFADYIIYSNGACVFDRRGGKILSQNMIPWETAGKILRFLNQYPVFYEVYKDGYSNMQKNKLHYFNKKDLPEEFLTSITERIVTHDNLEEALKGQGIEKINLFYIPSEHEREIRGFAASLPEIHATSAIADDIEITAATADKGTALEGICNALGVSARETMALGDAGNDCGMLQFAGCSVAMGNATQECKRTAKHIALSNAEDGLARAVEKYVLEESVGTIRRHCF